MNGRERHSARGQGTVVPLCLAPLIPRLRASPPRAPAGRHLRITLLSMYHHRTWYSVTKGYSVASRRDELMGWRTLALSPPLDTTTTKTRKKKTAHEPSPPPPAGTALRILNPIRDFRFFSLLHT